MAMNVFYERLAEKTLAKYGYSMDDIEETYSFADGVLICLTCGASIELYEDGNVGKLSF